MFKKASFLLIKFLYFFIIFGFISPVFLFSNGEIIVLDSGHSPSNFGALSVSGKTEVEYNDNFTNELKKTT